MSGSSVRQAATVLVLRDGSSGPEIFMVQRHRRSGFLPNAWVFPGGRVDDTDQLTGHPRVLGGSQVLAQMELTAADGIGYLVAAVRETFEEAGVWLGEGTLPDAQRGPLNRGEVRFDALLDAHDARVELDRLHAWSWWITPEQEPRRYDTRFLVAHVRGADMARHDAHETVDSCWIRLTEAVERSATGSMKMAPPTWWTLKELAEHKSVDAIVAAAHARPNRPIQPIIKMGSGFELLLPGHPEHPASPIEGLPSTIRFHQGHWWAS